MRIFFVFLVGGREVGGRGRGYGSYRKGQPCPPLAPSLRLIILTGPPQSAPYAA